MIFKDENDDDVTVLDLDSKDFDDGQEPANGASRGSSIEAEARPSEADEWKKKYLYLAADFDNYRKQAVKERSELVKFGNEPVLREFLTVLDNLERAASIETTPETIANYKNGVQLIVSQFKKTLEKFGVEEVDCLGQSFDPNIHEALSSAHDEDAPPNTVVQAFNKAYKLRGKVIRPAQVVVNTFNKEN